MQLQVTEIEFDFETDEGFPSIDYQSEVIQETLGNIYEIDMDDYDDFDDEDIAYELMEEVSASTGWCIKSIDYRHVLS